MSAPDGFYRAVVKAMDGNIARVTIIHLGGQNIYPARVMVPVGEPNAAFGATSIPVGSSSLSLRPLQAGDEVVVAFLEGHQDSVVVVGLLA